MAVRLFFAGLIVLLVFLGCGGGGGGGGSGSGLLPGGSSVVVSGTISGTIAIDQAVSALRPDISSFSPSLRFLDSFVMIEELPNVSTRADQDGKFVFENVPFGTYRIIARVTSLSGRMYKLRTTAQSLTQSDSQKSVALNVTQPDLAEHQIRMMIKDLNGNPIGKCKVWFWGEQFTLDASGYYVSPYMPAGASGLIKVEPPADKGLSSLEFNIPATTFNPDNVEIVGVTLPTAGITNRAPIVSITTGKYPEGGSAFLRLFGSYSDPEGEPMTTSWLTNVSTFTYVAKDYADWAVPSISASVTVYFSASEDGRYYPRLTSLANLNINVASSGEVSFPGEILLRPVTRSVDIAGSSTAQIPGNTLASYEAKTNFPPGLQLYYNWTVDRGTMISSATGSILSWRSPALSPGATQIASIAVAVTDGIGTATKEIQVRITSVPTITINQPAATAFEPGLIVFTGSARDYLNTAISPDSMSWYVATDTQPFVLGQTGGATFSWQFVTQGSYTVALEAFDANGVTGTGTKKITIINARPVCAITQPLNDASFRPNTPVTFVGTANDQEDGAITDATRLVWTSDIDGVIGSGPTFTVATMTPSRHAIRFSATDSGGAVGSASIVIWYDVPARISLTPADRSVFFAGYNIPFSAVGTDTDNTPLDSSQFKWYLNDLPDIWRDGASFSVTAGAYVPGANRVRVEGPAQFETAVSPTHVIQMGWPVASITSPASGTRFEPLDLVSFTAVPDSTGTLSLQWYLNSDPTSFGSGANVSYGPPNGLHRVTYVGSDSQGIVSSSTISFVVERVPLVSFLPTNGSYLFASRPINFAATCIDTNNNDIPDNKVRWLLNGNLWALANGKNFSVTQPTQLSSGTYQITLIATGPYGTSGAITNTVVTGVPLAKILSPANNQTFTTGAEISFAAAPDSIGPVLLEWWCNYGQSGAIKFGDGANATSSILPDGYNYISYLGTDSSGFVSSHSIRIGIGEFPTMDFTPGQGTVFFASHDVVFTGIGSDSVDGSIPGGRMAWYIDGVLELASYSVMTITPARIAVLGAGLKEVELRGYNTLGAAGSTVKKIYLGVPIAVIASPSVSDAIIPTATPCDFAAIPDNVSGAEITEPLTMQWWLNYSQPGALQIGNGQSLTYTLPAGLQYLTYVGTDSQNVVSSATIRIRVSDSPSITFTPQDGSRLFVDQSFELKANDAVVIATSVVWSLDGGATVWRNGSPYIVVPGDLSVGLHNITAVGENDLGVVASITNSIYYGVALASITSPASGAEYLIAAPLNTPVNFAAVPVPSAQVPMQWYRNNGGGAVYMGNTANLTGYAMPQGRHTVTYVGSDSVGFISSSSIQILINTPPPMAITPGNSSTFFAGRPVSFTGSGTSVISGAPVAGSTMKWNISGGSSQTGSSTVAYEIAAQAPLYPLSRTLTLEGTDDLGTSNVSSPIDVYFGYPAASITVPASGSRYDELDPITFAGYPDDGAIAMQWYRDGVLFHTGPNPPVQSGWPTGIRTIRYQGTDASGYVSSATIQILISDKPSVAVLPAPGDNLVYFANRPVTLTATGTTASLIPVATFSWYVNGSGVASHSGLTFPIPANTLSAAASPHSIKLEGTDEYGVKNDTTISISFLSQPVISSPLAGARYATGTSVLFEGTPGSLLPNLVMEWWYGYGTASSTLMSSGNSINYTLPYGSHNVTYLATDSSGFVGSASVQVLISDIPRLKITPSTGGIFFAGRPVTIYGTGSDTIDNTLNAATFKWYVDDVLQPLLSGQQNAIFSSGEPAPGLRKITLSGSDGFGTAGTDTAWLTFRHGVASITSIASGSMWDYDLSVNLVGSPTSQLAVDMKWYVDGAGPLFSDAGPHTYGPFSRGWRTITYLGTDSAQFCSSSTIQILGNRPPTLDFTPAGTPIFFTGRPVTLNGFGTNAAGASIASASIDWSVNSFSATGATATINILFLNPGINAVKVSGSDEFNTVGSRTRNIYYGYPVASITFPASGTVFSSISNSIVCAAVPESSPPEIVARWYLNSVATGAVSTGITFANLPLGVHTITYLASDSSGFESSSTIQITVNDTPALEILPLNNLAAPKPFYFVGQPAQFIGSGTSQAGAAINPANNMKWYVNGGALAFTGSPATLTAQLSPGLNTVKLTATDTLNAYAETTTSVRFGVPALSISYPASGTTLPMATLASFTGSDSPAAPHDFVPAWYDVTGAPVLLGTGNSITGIGGLAHGWHTIRYLATDSSGFVSSATIMILKNNEPDLNITPGDNSIFFTGRPIDLTGSGISNPGGVTIVNPLKMKWYVNGTDRGTGLTKQLQTAWLVNGNNTVTIVGTDEYGTVGTFSQTIYYGYALPSISIPASGAVFLSTDNISFAANPAAYLGATPEWWINGVKVSTVATFTSLPLATGTKTVSYIATDSSFAASGFIGSSTIQIMVNNAPKLTFSPASGSYFFAGQPVSFTGLGTSSAGLAISSASMSWYLNGSAIPILNSPALVLAASFMAGANSMVLRATDEFGTVGEVTGNNLFYGVPTVSITYPPANMTFATGTLASFTGSPDMTPYGLTSRWYHEAGSGAPRDLGGGAGIVNVNFNPGWHTVRYVATDSAGFVSSTTLNILFNDAPIVRFLPPANGLSDIIVFTSSSFNLTGSGTDSIAPYTIIPPGNFRWYKNFDSAVWKNGSPVAVNTAELSPGWNDIYVSAYDSKGTYGTGTHRIYNAHPLLNISSYASGSRVGLSDTVNMVENAASAGISLSWILNTIDQGVSASTFNNVPLTDGWNTLIYRGVDGAGGISSSTIMLLKDDPPNISVNTASNSVFFINSSFTLSATGLNSIPPNNPINPASFKWYRDADPTVFKTGISPLVSSADLSVGTHTFYVSGVDDFNIVGTSTVKAMYYGHPLLYITSHASGSTVGLSDTVNLAGTPASSAVALSWKLNGAPTAITSSVYNNVPLIAGWNTIDYIGSDSAGNISSNSIMLLKNNLPTMQIIPGNGSRFFNNSTVSFLGSGTASFGGTPIASATMNWYLDLAGTPTRSATATAVFAPGTLTLGSHNLSLTGSDSYGTSNSTSISFFYGHDNPSILLPASGTRVNIASNVTFLGSPDTGSGITTSWYLSHGLPGEALMGTGKDLVLNFPVASRGYQLITYLATDSANFLSTSTVQILVNSLPTMTVTQPAASVSYYFGGQNIDFSGSGTNSGGGAILAASMTWYLNGAVWKTGVDNFSATVAELPTGTYNIRFEGVDNFGTVGSVTISVQTGLANPQITFPASGTRYDTGSNVSYTGTPDLTGLINMQWRWVEGPMTLLGNGPAVSSSLINTRGWQRITYSGTDSKGTSRSAEIMLLMDKLPTFSTPPSISVPAQYGSGPLLGGINIPIHLVYSGNYAFTFNAAAIDEDAAPISPASITWYIGASYMGAGSTIVGYNIETPGSYTLTLYARDKYDQIASISKVFWVWETENYAPLVNTPTSLMTLSATELIVADPADNVVKKLIRDSTAGLGSRGDITAIATQTTAASITPYILQDVTFSGGNMYTLETDLAQVGNEHRIQGWAIGDFSSLAGVAFYKAQGTAPGQFSNPKGIAVEAGSAIYVADWGNDLIKKLDVNTGAFFSQSQTVFDPIGIRYLGAESLYVADSGTSRVKRFKSDLNSVADWVSSANATNATHFIIGAPGNNIYVTDPAGARVNVIASSGAMLYSFGVSGAGFGQFVQPWGITIAGDAGAYDMYVTDRTGSKIVRFRSNAW